MICPGKKCAKEIPDDAILCCYCGRKIKKKKSYRSHGNGIGSVYKRGDTYTAVAIVGWYKRASDGKKLPLKNTEGGFKSETDAFLFLPELRKRPHKLQRIKAISL
jgi:hypothetical protein